MNLYPFNSQHKRFIKTTDPEYQSQERRFYNYLTTAWYTCREVSVALDITISNCTIYKRTYEKMGLLWTSPKKYRCPITGKAAHRITSNLELAKKELPHLSLSPADPFSILGSLSQGDLFKSEEVYGG